MPRFPSHGADFPVGRGSAVRAGRLLTHRSGSRRRRPGTRRITTKTGRAGPPRMAPADRF
ncbi:hypothetical protein ACFPN7_05500 [Amycolatopsis halotolerans]|uniref:hypothetical protein n=1 Tax=Amycolatopsis halotolerans TaxID=330083 RepID=UPI00361B0C2B